MCIRDRSTGVETKIERGNRVFPLSDKSSDVIWALDKMMKDIGVNVHLKSEITKIENSNNKVILIDKHNNKFAGDKCIVATGGMSYETVSYTHLNNEQQVNWCRYGICSSNCKGRNDGCKRCSKDYVCKRN